MILTGETNIPVYIVDDVISWTQLTTFHSTVNIGVKKTLADSPPAHQLRDQMTNYCITVFRGYV